jgi:hypothetical protein
VRVALIAFCGVVASNVVAWAVLERRGHDGGEAIARPAAGRARSSVDAGVTTLAGPWGQLELREIELEPPPGFLRPEMCDAAAPVWKMPGLGADEAARLYVGAGVAPARRAILERFTTCGGGGCEARPDLAFLEGLPPVERAGLYGALARFEPNAALRAPMFRHPGEIERAFHDVGVSSPTLALLRGVLYRDGEREAFNDMALLCSRAASDQERVRLLDGVVRTPAIFAELRVPPGADVEAIARYWCPGKRAKDVHALIASLAASPSGGAIDVVHLVPRFVRARVNSYPEPGDPPYDCLYSALGFFSLAGDDRHLDPAQVKRTIDEEYRPLGAEEPRLGDLLLFMQPDGTILHAVAVIAGDLVFTKNGGAFHWPWILAHRKDVETQFGNPKVVAFRRKNLDPVN